MKRFAAVLALALVACSNVSAAEGSSPAATPAYDAGALPSGPVGDQIRYGHDLIVNTRKLMPQYVKSNMDCAACHVEAGTKARAGSFLGTFARFPQWNVRAHRVIALQDRLAECFLYSMNGRPPAYASKEMVALVAYVAWLSRGTPVGAPQNPDDRFIEPLPAASPNVAHGGEIYAQKCAACHQANGAGMANTFPPLWGETSFNSGAGMAHIDRMTGFVRYNMPQNAPGSLSQADAYDVSAWVLTHDRPKFAGTTPVSWPPEPASDF